MNLRNLILSIVAISALGASASAEIEWLQTEYDFGTFTEESGKKTGEVKLVNKGDEATIISKVRPTCGCTVAQYTQGEIAPGDTAYVRFTYNPAGRPGKFDKSIKVHTGFDNKLTTIKIRGTVIGKKSTLSKQYPIEIGALRLSKNAIILGDLTKGLSRHEFIHGYNQSQDTIYPTWGDTHNSISIGMSSTAVAPGDLVTISIYYNSRAEENLGLNIYPIEIYANESDSITKGVVEMTVNLKADTSKLTAEEMKKAPALALESEVIDLGTVSTDEHMRVSIKIKNDGKSQMIINRIYSLNDAINFIKMPTKINANKAERAECEIDMKALPKGPFNIKAEIITNDPLHPTATVRIVGIKK